MGYICLPKVVQAIDLMNVDPGDEANHLPLNQIYLGAEMHTLHLIKDICKYLDMVRDVQFRFRQFMITLCLDNKLWWMSSFLAPKHVLNNRARRTMPSLHDPVKAVPHIYQGNVQDLGNEWRSLYIISLQQKLN